MTTMSSHIIIDEHINLIHKVITNLFGDNENADRIAKLTNHSYDDIFQTGLIGLWQATLKFKPTKGKFSTYAYKSIKNHILKLTSNEKQRRENKLNKSLYEKIVNDEEETTLLDLIEDKNCNFEDVVMDHVDVDLLINKLQLTKQQKDIVLMLSEGYSYTEIGDKLGTSRQNVGNQVNCIRKKSKNINEWK